MTDKTKGVNSGRRHFIKHIGISSVALAGASSLPIILPAKTNNSSSHKSNVQYGMLIDTRRCVGCHACSVACRSENKVPMGLQRSWVEYVEKGNFPDTSVNFIPRLCNQCSDAVCVDVCPADATHKREQDGIVTVDAQACIGCELCIEACPYDARFLIPETDVVDKCDFCVDRLEQGLQPACVETCFQGARIIGDINDPDSEISRLLAKNKVTVLKREKGTQPNVFYIAEKQANDSSVMKNDQYLRITTHRTNCDKK